VTRAPTTSPLELSMSRSLTRLAIAAIAVLGPCAGVHAQSVELFGLLDMSAGTFQNAGTARQWRSDSGNMSTSFIGFKGSEDLGGGLKAKFAIEHFLRLDNGSAGRFGGDAFWSRDAYVGLSGAFGTTTLGRNTTPLFVSTLLFNAFGDSFGFSPSIRQVFTPSLLPFFGDSGWNNSMAYASNDNDGLSFNLLGNLSEGASGAVGKNVSGNLLYFKGPLGATASWQRVRNGAFGTPPGWTGQNTWQVGASYELGVAKVYGQYTQVRNHAFIDSKTAIWGFGAAAPLGPGRVLVQFGDARAEQSSVETKNRTVTLGYDYALSKNSDLYAVVMNDRVTGLSNGNTLAAGVRLRF
jgi:predicted porin